MATIKSEVDEIVDAIAAERDEAIADLAASKDAHEKEVAAHDATKAKLAHAEERRNSGSRRTRVAAASRLVAEIDRVRSVEGVASSWTDGAVLALDRARAIVEAMDDKDEA